MPKVINNADAAQSLTAAYALKGRVQLQLDEMVVPVAIVDDLRPVSVLRPCGGEANQIAVSAQFAYGGVQTQAGFALFVEGFLVFNSSSNPRTVFLKEFSAANLATIGITVASLIAFDIPKDSTTVGSQTFIGTDASEVGVLIGAVRIPANDSKFIQAGVTIYGIDNPARVAVGLQGESTNSLIRAIAYCVERDELS